MSQATENNGLIYEFGKFVLDPNERILLADGKPIHLTNKVFDTLLLLVHNNGRLVTKDEMMSSIGEESFVEEGNLAKNISRLRKILNVNGKSLIQTLPRRGYRFSADVKEIDGGTTLLVRRNLRVKITQTTEDENSEIRSEDENVKQIERVAPRLRKSRLSIAIVAVLFLALASGLGFYFWESDKSVVHAEPGVIRLTDDPADDFFLKWTTDGRIRFFRMGSDKKGKNMSMNADGTDQTEIEVKYPQNYFHWSPDGSKAIFAKPGDKTARYLANADGSNEITMPLMGTTDWSVDSKKIVYQSRIGENKNSELFIYSLESGKTENITNHPGFDADPSFSWDGKQIVYTSIRDGNADIYLMNSDGSNVRRLTDHRAFDNHPAFSPDGTVITFNSDRENENEDVYVMSADGSNLTKLTHFDKSNETTGPGGWSPDGTKIAFVSNINGNDDIYVTSAEVFQPQLVLADEKSDLQFPSYSPDGKYIVFQSALPDKSGEIRLYDTENRQTRVLLRTENADLAPVFSPDGSQIVFQNKIESNTEICLINADGSGFTNLTQNSARDVMPTFSLIGREVIFASDRNRGSGHFDLFAISLDDGSTRQIYANDAGMSVSPVASPTGEIVFMNDKEDGQTGNFEIFKIGGEAGSAEQRLTFRRRYDGQPAISPDGKRIAFVSNGDGNAEIYLMNTDGTGLLRLTRNSSADLSPRFSPDGQRIIFSSNRGGKFALYKLTVAE